MHIHGLHHIQAVRSRAAISGCDVRGGGGRREPRSSKAREWTARDIVEAVDTAGLQMEIREQEHTPLITSHLSAVPPVLLTLLPSFSGHFNCFCFYEGAFGKEHYRWREWGVYGGRGRPQRCSPLYIFQPVHRSIIDINSYRRESASSLSAASGV